MKKWNSLANKLDNFNKAISTIARWAVMFMLSIGIWNVIGRYLGVAIGFNLSSNLLIEAQWYLFDLIFLLGLSWSLQTNNHVRVDVLQKFWKNKQKNQIELLGILLMLIPFALGVMLISINPTIESWRISELSPDPNGLPRYWVKTLIPIGFLLLLLQGISQAIKQYSIIKRK